MNEAEAYERALGMHWLRVEGDSMFVTVRETLKAEDIRALFELADPIKRKYNRVFFVYDGRQCTGIEPAGRKVVPKVELDDAEAVLRVIFGISFPLRVVLNMLIRAQKALFKRDVRVHIFEGEDEALAFFDKERERLRKKFGPSHAG